MSLVVAKIVNEAVVLVSDTKVGDPTSSRPGHSLLKGSLKAVLINPELCIAYAGSVEPALSAIRAVHRSHGQAVPREGIIALLLQTNESSKDNTHFIAAFAGTAPSLWRIRNGAIETDILDAWIGDSEGFEAYQVEFARQRDDPFSMAATARLASLEEEIRAANPVFPIGTLATGELVAQMERALEALINNHMIQSVGDFVIRTSSRSASGGGFRYFSRNAGYDFHPVTNTNMPTSLIRPKGAEGGGYNYTLLVPERPGIGAIAVYFLQIGLGSLFYPLRSDAAVLYREVDCAEFIRRVGKDYGFELTGILWTTPFDTTYAFAGCLGKSLISRSPRLRA